MGKKGAVRLKQVGGPKAGAANAMAAQQNLMLNPMQEMMSQLDPSELSSLKLPSPTLDRSYQVYWPLHETFSMDASKFQVIYPNYMDARKTIHLGRRISVARAVHHPTIADLSGALQMLGVRHVLQPYKGYSRDPTTLWDNPGRVLVDVTRYNKATLLRELAATIPSLPPRLQRLKQQEAEQLEYEQQKTAYEASIRQQQQQHHAPKSSTNTTTTTTHAHQHRKGKKGKK